MKTRQKIKIRESREVSGRSERNATQRRKSRRKSTQVQSVLTDAPITIPIRVSDRPHPRRKKRYFLTHAAVVFLTLTIIIPLSAHIIDKTDFVRVALSPPSYIPSPPNTVQQEDAPASPVSPVITHASFIFPSQQSKGKEFPTMEIAGKVFHWIDEKMKSTPSNLHYAPNRGIVKMFDEIDSYQRVTKIVIDGKQIFVPVTLKHKGRVVTVDMILDTGCTLTSIPYQYLEQLKPINSKKIRFKLANGNTANGWLAEIDSIQVGTQETTQFELAGSTLKENHEYGQLGMDFLRNHQFRIDMKNGQIIWM